MEEIKKEIKEEREKIELREKDFCRFALTHPALDCARFARPWIANLPIMDFNWRKEISNSNDERGDNEFKVEKVVRIRGNGDSDELVSVIMMLKSEKSNYFVVEINFEDEYKTFQDMNSSFSREVMSEGFVVCWVLNNLNDLSFKSSFEDWIFLRRFIYAKDSGEYHGLLSMDESLDIQKFQTNPAHQCRVKRKKLFDISLTSWFNFIGKNHSNYSNISDTDLSLIAFSFFASSNSFTKDSFNGSSSTGCQSIFSQNSQSSSVIEWVCLYLSDMSFFISLTTDSAKETKSIFVCSFGSSINSSMDNEDEDSYINVSALMGRSINNDKR